MTEKSLKYWPHIKADTLFTLLLTGRWGLLTVSSFSNSIKGKQAFFLLLNKFMQVYLGKFHKMAKIILED